MSFTIWHAQQHSKQKKLFHKNANPRALLITRNFPPLVGGMERLNYNMYLEMAKAYEVELVGPSGAQAVVPCKARVWQCPSKSIYEFLPHAAFYTLVAAIRLRPWIVLAGSGLTAPIACAAAKITGSRSLVYLHGLDIAVENPFYQGFWRPFFRHFDRVLVNSEFTKSLAEKAGIGSSKIVVLHPGVDLPDMKVSQQKREIFRNRYNLGKDPLMLYVGRITSRKGLTVFVKDILPRIIKIFPKAKLMVIGDNPSLALFHKDNEGQIVRRVLQKNGLNNSVIFLGYVSDDDLDAAYFAVDVLIFPVQQHSYDNEGFGMVAIEAAAHGLPLTL